MDDLVKRLRDDATEAVRIANHIDDDEMQYPRSIALFRDDPRWQAADRIERLEQERSKLERERALAERRAASAEATLREIGALVSKDSVSKYTLNGIVRAVREKTDSALATPKDPTS